MRQAILLAIVGDGLLTFMDALIKSLVARYSTLEVAFLRFGLGGVWAAALVAVARPGWPTRETIFYNATRSVLAVVTATSFFYALGQLPLADAVALSFLSPMFLAIFGAVFLGERIDHRIALALAASAAGMLLIAGGRVGTGGYAAGALYGAAACVISAISYALVLVLLRARARHDALAIIVLFQNVGPAVLLAIPAAFVWVTPSLQEFGLLAFISLLGVSGHYMLALAFARAEAARLAPLQYTQLVWGAVFGYLLFSDVPKASTWLGAALIMLGAFVTQGAKSVWRGKAKRQAGMGGLAAGQASPRPAAARKQQSSAVSTEKQNPR